MGRYIRTRLDGKMTQEDLNKVSEFTRSKSYYMKQLTEITDPATLHVGAMVIGEEYVFDDDTDVEYYRFHPLRIDGVSENDNIDIDGNECRYSGNWMDDCDSENISAIYHMPITRKFLDENFRYSESLCRWEVGLRLQYGNGNNGYIIMRLDGKMECTLYSATVNKISVREWVDELQKDLLDVGYYKELKAVKEECSKYNYTLGDA